MTGERMLLLAIAALLLVDNCQAACSKVYGPTGGIDCIYIERYGGYQWATCLTDAYIIQTSGGLHLCEDRTTTYCYYQCMIEEFKVEKGYINSKCSCKEGQTEITTAKPKVEIPEWCLSPSGTDCSWYSTCLEARHPCEESSNAYAISFAKKFCNLYSDVKNNFSKKGQEWIDATRKCLQVSLVPLLRPWETPSCADIQAKAIASHSGCYLSPFPGAPSMCDLPVVDWWRVFWTIKGGFVNAAIPTLKGMWQVAQGCSKSYISDAVGYVKLLKIQIKNVLGRKRRDLEDEQSVLAGDVADALGTLLNWNGGGIAYFAFYDNSTSTDFMNITILIADKAQVNLHIQGTGSLDLNLTVNDLAQHIANETFHLRLNSNDMHIPVYHLSGCRDSECEETYLPLKVNVTDPPGKGNFGVNLQSSVLMVGLIAYFAGILHRM